MTIKKLDTLFVVFKVNFVIFYMWKLPRHKSKIRIFKKN